MVDQADGNGSSIDGLPEITMGEWMAALDRVRPELPDLTDEQYIFIKYARENDSPVPWKAVLDLWEKHGWGRIPKTTLLDRYDRARHERT